MRLADILLHIPYWVPIVTMGAALLTIMIVNNIDPLNPAVLFFASASILFVTPYAVYQAQEIQLDDYAALTDLKDTYPELTPIIHASVADGVITQAEHETIKEKLAEIKSTHITNDHAGKRQHYLELLQH